MTTLARELSRDAWITVVDGTGLSSYFQFDLTMQIGGRGREQHQSASEFKIQNFREALKPIGLKLEYKKLPADFIVIDRLSRIPTPN